MPKTLSTLYYIIGLLNLDPRVFSLQIVVQKILILNLQTFVLQWELDIHQEHLTHHGQMV